MENHKRTVACKQWLVIKNNIYVFNNNNKKPKDFLNSKKICFKILQNSLACSKMCNATKCFVKQLTDGTKSTGFQLRLCFNMHALGLS